jgi:hypothetical protein
MSALPPKADITRHLWDVRFVPRADSCTGSHKKARWHRKAERLRGVQSDCHICHKAADTAVIS